MVDDGKGIEDVAVRFGVSLLTVQRRLKLSSVSPNLLAEYRQDRINLDQLMALALSDDHGAQERAWFDAQPWNRSPAALCRVLTTGEIEAAGSAIVRFVGVAAYEAAGGVVRRDLFDDAKARFLSDAGLVQRLAAEKLEGLVQAVRAEGWAWVEARVEVDSHCLRQFSPCGHSLRTPSAEEEGQLAELSQRSDELNVEGQALGATPHWTADDAERIDLEEQDIEARRKAVEEGLKVWTPESKARAGAIVTIGRQGDAEIIRGLLREADRKALDAARRAASVEPTGGAIPNASDTSASLTAGRQCRLADGSDGLRRRLAAHRTVALQALLSRNTSVALAALTHVLVQRVFGDEYRRNRCLQITPQFPTQALQAAADDLKDSAAWKAVEASKRGWKERLPEQPDTWLQWLIALPQKDLIDLLAFCTASTLNALPGNNAENEASALAVATGLDMADWWEATATGYLNHVPKAKLIEALKEAGAGGEDGGIATLKKDALVAVAAARLAGKRWLPTSLRQRAI